MKKAFLEFVVGVCKEETKDPTTREKFLRQMFDNTILEELEYSWPLLVRRAVFRQIIVDAGEVDVEKDAVLVISYLRQHFAHDIEMYLKLHTDNPSTRISVSTAG